MRSYAARALLSTIAGVLALTLLIFALIRLVPGDALTVWIGAEGTMTPEVQATLRKMFGLADPMWLQYLHWLGDLLHGDLGYSFRTRLPVGPLIAAAVPYTLELALGATFLSTLVAVPLGMLSAVKRNSSLDVASRLLALVGLSMPTFWIGVLFILVSTTVFGWLPSLIFVSLFQHPLENLSQVAMPCLTLALPLMGVVMRMTRSSMLEVLGQDYIRTARAKGVSLRTLIFSHALRNALVPIVTVLGIQLGQLLGGAVIVEVIFGVPGLGTLLVSAITQRDYPMVQGAMLLIGLTFILVQLCVDFSYTLLDPRVQRA